MLGRQETGVSAGINATPEDRDAAVAAFAAEVAGWDAGYRFVAAKGVDAGALGASEAASEEALLAAGAVAAARASAATARSSAARLRARSGKFGNILGSGKCFLKPV